MATGATINIKQKDGNILQTRINWDGYISWVGKVLLNHFKSPYEVLNLINGGEVCSFKIDNNDECVIEYYNDDDYYPRVATHWAVERYNYIFDENLNKWFVNFKTYNEDSDEEFELYIPLSEAIENYSE